MEECIICINPRWQPSKLDFDDISGYKRCRIAILVSTPRLSCIRKQIYRSPNVSDHLYTPQIEKSSTANLKHLHGHIDRNIIYRNILFRGLLPFEKKKSGVFIIMDIYIYDIIQDKYLF